jgi:hypothetical protein
VAKFSLAVVTVLFSGVLGLYLRKYMWGAVLGTAGLGD